MTAVDLAEYVGTAPDDTLVASCWNEAVELVDQYVGTDRATGQSRVIPASVRSRACLEVGSELYHRRSAPNGVAQFAALDGAPVRVARDPMIGAYPILNRFLPGGFA